MAVLAPNVTREMGEFPFVPCLPLDSAQQLLTAPDKCRYRRLLLPIDDHFLAAPDLAELLDVTRQNESELILLHVGRVGGLDLEGLFSALRGLQAHAQQRLVSVRVESMSTDTMASVLDYAHEHQVDLIVTLGNAPEA